MMTVSAPQCLFILMVYLHTCLAVELPEIEVRRSINGLLHTSLHVNVSRLLGPISWNRRSFEGKPTGPTLRVRPGDRLIIDLVNDLGNEGPTAAGEHFTSAMEKATSNGTNYTGNWLHDKEVYAYPNSTNIHLHGMHVSPLGRSDNVSRRCLPGQTLRYIYDIPLDHTRGLYWYHPHFDGSSALQVASGMVGALIVEDDKLTMPASLGELKEVLVLFHEVAHSNGHWPWPKEDVICYFCIDNFAWPAGDRLPMNKVYNDATRKQCGKEPKFWPGTSKDFAQTTQPFDCTYMLLNGEYMPEITMRPREWQRLRLVQSSHNSAMRLAFPPDCELLLLAMDGLYLKEPRNITRTAKQGAPGFVFTAGSRADIAIMCPSEGSFPLSTLSGGVEWSHVSWFKNLTKDLYEPVLYPQQIATVVVKGGSKPMDPPVELPPMGCYPDLLNDTLVSARYTVIYNLTAYGTSQKHPKLNPIMQFLNGGQFSINGESFLGRPTRCMLLGSVEEWTIVNAVNDLSRWLHSFHIHVNPYQIVSMNRGINAPTSPNATLGQFMVEDLRRGEWRDTVQVPVGGNVTIRFLNKDFTGRYPFHCHVTAHQGIGMMQLVETVKDLEECTGRHGEESIQTELNM